MAFSFNSRAKYPTGATEVLSATQAAITSDALIKLQIQVRSSDGFQTQYPDVFEKYRPPNVNLDKIVQAWKSTPMQFWQTRSTLPSGAPPRVAAFQRKITCPHQTN